MRATVHDPPDVPPDVCRLDALPALLEYARLEEEWGNVVGHAGVEAFIARHKVPVSADCQSHDTGEWLKRKRRAALELARAVARDL